MIERLDEQVPLDVELIDEEGKKVKLGDILSREKPTVLSLVYYDCPSLCSLVLNGITKSVRRVGQKIGEDYQLLSISIDPRDTPEKSRERRKRQLEALGLPQDAAWRFLTGEEAQVRRVADAVGFGYALDEASGQYAHPAALMVLSPEAKVNRYLYGVDFPRRISTCDPRGRRGPRRHHLRAHHSVLLPVRPEHQGLQLLHPRIPEDRRRCDARNDGDSLLRLTSARAEEEGPAGAGVLGARPASHDGRAARSAALTPGVAACTIPRSHSERPGGRP